jgi:hypothetical protein
VLPGQGYHIPRGVWSNDEVINKGKLKKLREKFPPVPLHHESHPGLKPKLCVRSQQLAIRTMAQPNLITSDFLCLSLSS